MISLGIGAIIGVVMGLTGAGGALIAIPLFLTFSGMQLKEASVYSLVAVIIASLFNFIPQRQHSDFKLALTILSTSILGSFLFVPVKALLPDLVISIMLAMISLFALYKVWVPSPKVSGEKGLRPSIFITLSLGLVLGALTTLTGLGGGVLMMPIFLSLYSMNSQRAVATSVVAVGLSSLFSMLIQVQRGFHIPIDPKLAFLILGIFISATLLAWLTKKISANSLDLTRKFLFTFVVVIALLKIFTT